ncbi:MAG TPA: hypothetical protein EYN67_00840 [Flavobacteriales bacterium]|nr:hypothetical protein [Flavobacteriales bacterium]
MRALTLRTDKRTLDYREHSLLLSVLKVKSRQIRYMKVYLDSLPLLTNNERKIDYGPLFASFLDDNDLTRSHRLFINNFGKAKSESILDWELGKETDRDGTIHDNVTITYIVPSE